MGATDNVKVFEAGMRRAEAAIQKEFVRIGTKVARDLIGIAVTSYQAEDANLTGNLLNSICGGVYFNRNLQMIVKPRVEEATYSYAHVGDTGFLTYDEKKPIDYVRQYRGSSGFRFQPASQGDGTEDAIDFLMGFKPEKSNICIVICAAAPYAEYLQNTRKLDVLMTTHDNASDVFMTYIELANVKL